MQAGDVLDNRYHLIEQVGESRSKVFLARDSNLTGKLVAVKVIDRTSKDFDSFIREKTLLSKLSHPGIPTIIQQIETETKYCVVINYYNGENLHERIERENKSVTGGDVIDMHKREAEVIEWFKSICEILIYIHTAYKKQNSDLTAPVIHSDIKPENIMIEDSGVKLIDWGAAGEFRRGVPYNGLSWRSPFYAAPEQEQAGAKYIDERTDIFSLGATMYYALTSVLPPKDKRKIPVITSINSNISEGMGIIIDKCLKYSPEDRYQSAAELLDDLNHVDTLTKKTRTQKMRSLVLFGICIFFCIEGVTISLVSNAVIDSRNSDNYMSKISLADKEYADALYYQRSGDAEKSDEAIGRAAEYYKQAIVYDKTNVDTYERLFDCLLKRDFSSYNESSYDEQLMSAIDIMRRQYVDEKNSGVYHSNRLMYLIAQNCLSLSDKIAYSGYAIQYLDLIRDSRSYKRGEFNDGFSKVEIDSMYLIATSLSISINDNNVKDLVAAMENLESETDSSVNNIEKKLTNYLNLVKLYNRYSSVISRGGYDPYKEVLRIGEKSRNIIENQLNYSEDLSFSGVVPLYQSVAESQYEAATVNTDAEIRRGHYETALEWFQKMEEELFVLEMSPKLLLKYGNCYRGVYESYIQSSDSDSAISNSGIDSSYLVSAREIYSRVLAYEDASSDIETVKFNAQIGITFCHAYDRLYNRVYNGDLQSEYNKTVQMMKENQDKFGKPQLKQFNSLKSLVNSLGVS